MLIGEKTYLQLPAGTVVEPRSGLRVKGKDDLVDAYLLLHSPSGDQSPRSRGVGTLEPGWCLHVSACEREEL